MLTYPGGGSLQILATFPIKGLKKAQKNFTAPSAPGFLRTHPGGGSPAQNQSLTFEKPVTHPPGGGVRAGLSNGMVPKIKKKPGGRGLEEGNDVCCILFLLIKISKLQAASRLVFLGGSAVSGPRGGVGREELLYVLDRKQNFA